MAVTACSLTDSSTVQSPNLIEHYTRGYYDRHRGMTKKYQLTVILGKKQEMSSRKEQLREVSRHCLETWYRKSTCELNFPRANYFLRKQKCRLHVWPARVWTVKKTTNSLPAELRSVKSERRFQKAEAEMLLRISLTGFEVQGYRVAKV